MVVAFTIALCLCLAMFALLAFAGYLILHWAEELPLQGLGARSLCNTVVTRLRLLLADSCRDAFEEKVRELELASRMKTFKVLAKFAICGQTMFVILKAFTTPPTSNRALMLPISSHRGALEAANHTGFPHWEFFGGLETPQSHLGAAPLGPSIHVPDCDFGILEVQEAC